MSSSAAVSRLMKQSISDAEMARIAEYLSAYPPARGTKITLEDAVAAVRAVRDES